MTIPKAIKHNGKIYVEGQVYTLKKEVWSADASFKEGEPVQITSIYGSDDHLVGLANIPESGYLAKEIVRCSIDDLC